MSIQPRREPERAERERLIVTAAREWAETEGWDAVTTPDWLLIGHFTPPA
ncbi:hypothetical protein GCM10011579_050970 [Streptomyces albiflavescens]|uniref:Uncharacterized protein n=1 Tax=Streptomyces albiflavescens TaxID=1623582 RepID=A0A918D5V5_9ACTN|nr:hypothetical protein GCM10011579_050970 [Streptomyces albiflavescens]